MALAGDEKKEDVIAKIVTEEAMMEWREEVKEAVKEAEETGKGKKGVRGKKRKALDEQGNEDEEAV